MCGSSLDAHFSATGLSVSPLVHVGLFGLLYLCRDADSRSVNLAPGGTPRNAWCPFCQRVHSQNVRFLKSSAVCQALSWVLQVQEQIRRRSLPITSVECPWNFTENMSQAPGEAVGQDARRSGRLVGSCPRPCSWQHSPPAVLAFNSPDRKTT